MAKKIEGYLKLQVPAGSASPSPPIGPALGQRGLNIMEFCKAFNAATQELDNGAPIPDRDYDLPGQVVHVETKDAAGVLLPEKGGGTRQRRPGAGAVRSPVPSPWTRCAKLRN